MIVEYFLHRAKWEESILLPYKASEDGAILQITIEIILALFVLFCDIPKSYCLLNQFFTFT